MPLDLEYKREYNKKYREDNKETIKENNRIYRENNADRIKVNARLNQHNYDEYGRQWYIKNRERLLANDKLNYVKNRESILKSGREKIRSWKSRFSQWKRGAKVRNLEFDLTLEEIKSMPLVCYYTKQVLTMESRKPNTISLERIDNTKGYIKGNTVFCCSDINYMKNDLSKDEFIRLCGEVWNNREIKNIPTIDEYIV